jgi:ABC-type transport system involved in multi-copper enzyme maturation permease subunit
MARFVGTSLGCFMLLGILFTAVASVSREREQRTLDNLLTLPIRRTDILRAKWLGSILSVRRLAWGLVGIWVLAAATGGLDLLALPLLVSAWLAYAAFAASLGLWCSIVSTTKIQATMRALITCIAITAVSFALGKHTALTTPMGSLWVLALAWGEFDVFRSRPAKYGLLHQDELLAPLVGLICYAVAAVILWVASCESLRKEKGPRPTSAAP